MPLLNSQNENARRASYECPPRFKAIAPQTVEKSICKSGTHTNRLTVFQGEFI